MTRKSRGKKKATARRGLLTRFELAQALGVGLTTVDRLIAWGLRAVGRRGRAKTYDPAAARRLAQRLAPVQVAAADVLITDYRSHAEDLHDRRQREVQTWIADATWRPLWQQCVAVVARVTADWPGRLADRLGAVTAEERALVAWADGPRPAPPVPRRYLEPVHILALLTEPEAAHPWRPAARAGIATLAARGVGIEIDDDGRWMPWDPAVGMPHMPAAPDPWMRPLLDELASMIPSSAAWRGLQAGLTPAAVEPLPPPPQDVHEARAQWRAARSAYRQARVAIRRGHRRRADVTAQVVEAIATFRARWWQARDELARLAGDPEAVRARAEQIRHETLAQLLSLGGGLGESPAPSGGRPGG